MKNSMRKMRSENIIEKHMKIAIYIRNFGPICSSLSWASLEISFTKF